MGLRVFHSIPIMSPVQKKSVIGLHNPDLTDRVFKETPDSSVSLNGFASSSPRLQRPAPPASTTRPPTGAAPPSMVRRRSDFSFARLMFPEMSAPGLPKALSAPPTVISQRPLDLAPESRQLCVGRQVPYHSAGPVDAGRAVHKKRQLDRDEEDTPPPLFALGEIDDPGASRCRTPFPTQP